MRYHVGQVTSRRRGERRSVRVERIRIGLALFLGVWVAIAAGFTSGRGPGDGAIGVGSPAPDFELPVVGGGTVRLSDLRGKIVFVNFWATWCPPCRDEMPSMEVLNQKLASPDFEMLTISVDEGGEAVVREFMADLPHTYKLLLDPATTEDQLASATARDLLGQREPDQPLLANGLPPPEKKVGRAPTGGRKLRVQPGAQVVAEGLFLRRQFEIHHSPRRPTSRS